MEGSDFSKISFISYRHSGLIKAMKSIFPESRRRICAVHFYKNFSVDYPGAKLHSLFWTACNAYTEHVHKQAVEAIKKDSVATYEWLLKESVQNWARYTFPVELKCPDNTTNFVESFNGKIEKLRCKPIFTLSFSLLVYFVMFSFSCIVEHLVVLLEI